MHSSRQSGPQAEAEFRERARAARRMSPDERIRAGIKMFEDGCEAIRNQIRASFPDANQTVVDCLLRQVVRFAERRGLL
jgi:hypothetical protein